MRPTLAETRSPLVGVKLDQVEVKPDEVERNPRFRQNRVNVGQASDPIWSHTAYVTYRRPDRTNLISPEMTPYVADTISR